MIEEQKQCMQILDYIRPMTFTEEDKKKKKMNRQTPITFARDLLEQTIEPIGRIVRHHNHLISKYIGAACNTCNSNYKQNKYFLPIVIDSLRGYYSHLIMQ